MQKLLVFLLLFSATEANTSTSQAANTSSSFSSAATNSAAATTNTSTFISSTSSLPTSVAPVQNLSCMPAVVDVTAGTCSSLGAFRAQFCTSSSSDAAEGGLALSIALSALTNDSVLGILNTVCSEAQLVPQPMSILSTAYCAQLRRGITQCSGCGPTSSTPLPLCCSYCLYNLYQVCQALPNTTATAPLQSCQASGCASNTTNCLDLTPPSSITSPSSGGTAASATSDSQAEAIGAAHFFGCFVVAGFLVAYSR